MRPPIIVSTTNGTRNVESFIIAETDKEADEVWQRNSKFARPDMLNRAKQILNSKNGVRDQDLVDVKSDIRKVFNKRKAELMIPKEKCYGDVRQDLYSKLCNKCTQYDILTPIFVVSILAVIILFLVGHVIWGIGTKSFQVAWFTGVFLVIGMQGFWLGSICLIEGYKMWRQK